MDASSANSCHTCSSDDKDDFTKAKQKSYKRSSTSLEHLIEAKRPFAATSLSHSVTASAPVIREIVINNSQPFKNFVSVRINSDIQHIPQESPTTWNDTLPTCLQDPSSVNSIKEKTPTVSLIPFKDTSKDPYSKQVAFVRTKKINSRPSILKIKTILPVPNFQAFDSVSANKETVSEPDTSMPLKISSVFSLDYKSMTSTSEKELRHSSTALESSIKIEPLWGSAKVETAPVTLVHSSTDSALNCTDNPTPVPVMCVPNLSTIMKYRTENTNCDHDPKKSTPASVTAAFKRVIESIGKVPDDGMSDNNECPTILLPPDVQSMPPMPSFFLKTFVPPKNESMPPRPSFFQKPFVPPKKKSVAKDLYISENVQQAIRLKWKKTLCKSAATVVPDSQYNCNPVLLSKLKEIVSSNISRSKNELIANDLEDTSEGSESSKDDTIVNALSKNQNREHFPDVNAGPEYNKSSGNTMHCDFPKFSETLSCWALEQDKEIVQYSNIQTLLKTCKSCSVVLEKLPLNNAYFRTKCWKKFLKYKRTKGIRLKRMCNNNTKMNKNVTKVNEIIPLTLQMDSDEGELVSTNIDSICFDRSYILKKESQAHTDSIQSVSNERSIPTNKNKTFNEIVNESQGLNDALRLHKDTHLHSLVLHGNPDETMKLLNSSTSPPYENVDEKLTQVHVLPSSSNDPVSPAAKNTIAMKCVLLDIQDKRYLAMVPAHDLLKAEDGSTVIKDIGKFVLLKVSEKPTS